MRGDRGFQWKAPQHGLAERVDGADAHAAGQIEHAGEQGARLGPHIVRWDNAAFEQRTVQRRRVQPHPFRESVLQAYRHFRRRRLGESKTLDFLRRCAGQHQAQQAIGEQFGFAGPGGCGHEGGNLGVGGLQLPCNGAAARGLRIGHSSSPPADHSPTRANCA